MIYFLWRFIKIISKILGGRKDFVNGSSSPKETFSDIEEAKYEDVTPPKENGIIDDTESPKR